MLGQCRIASHSDPRECTSLRFKLSTGNFIHEMYSKYRLMDMAMLPQSSVGQMDREIQTRPPAERQLQLPKYLLLRVCTTINVNSSPHSAAYVRRWIRSALLQIMVCRLFGTKPLSEQTFRYTQELSPGPLVYRNKLQWNLNQNRKLFIHGNASEYIVCEMAAILSGEGDGLTERDNEE